MPFSAETSNLRDRLPFIWALTIGTDRKCVLRSVFVVKLTNLTNHLKSSNPPGLAIAQNLFHDPEDKQAAQNEEEVNDNQCWKSQMKHSIHKL